ncbi:MAG: SH3 domain-containing protein, partial [Chloroflexota bacterium]
MQKRLLVLMPVIVVIAAACQPTPVAVSLVDGTPTATLAPIVSLTPRLTATRVPTRTPRPTATPVPPTPTVSQTPTVTFTPTEVPPVIGVINSIQRVNVRTGPGFTYRDFDSVAPGTGVEIIGQSSDGNWLNVRLESGDEGWMAASLIRLQPTETPFPTFTPTTDETAIALGTEFPTAVVGSGTV